MTLQALLAFAHISTILAWVVFATGCVVLCRPALLRTGALPRLVRMDRALWLASAAVLLSGLARVIWGVKGVSWYAGNPLLHLKLALFLVVVALQVYPSRQYRRWAQMREQGHAVFLDEAVRKAWLSMLLATHLVAVIPLPAVFLARGFGA